MLLSQIAPMPTPSSSDSPRKKAISLRHIAEIAGVSRMTVSRAFKDEASVKPELRKKILQVAKELGYTPDTMVSELMTSFASRRPVSYKETFAAIWWPERWANVDKGHGFDADVLRGLNEGAQLHGRGIDHFVMTDEITPRVIERMLHARNIQGVILTPPASAEVKAPELNWDKLSAVTIGSSLREPAFNRSQPGHYTITIQALETLAERGYQRPCLLLRSDVEIRMLRAHTAAFLAWGYPKDHIWHASTPSAEGLSDWLKQVEPDVIIADWDPWYEFLTPEDRKRGFLSLAVRNPNGSMSGIYQNTVRIAKGAIDLLVRSRLTHEVGVPQAPTLMLTSGDWIEGQTLTP